MTAVPPVPSIASVLTFAAGAVLAGAIFGLTFVLEGQARDATRELERQTTIVAAVGRLGRTVDLMMTIPHGVTGIPPDYLLKENAGRRREYEEALDRVKRLTADDAEVDVARRITTVERSIDDWQRAVTVPEMQGRKTSGKKEDGAARAARVRDELRGLETGCLEALGGRRSAAERIAIRERMVGRWLAGAVAVGFIVACAIRWRAAWTGAPS